MSDVFCTASVADVSAAFGFVTGCLFTLVVGVIGFFWGAMAEQKAERKEAEVPGHE